MRTHPARLTSLLALWFLINTIDSKALMPHANDDTISLPKYISTGSLVRRSQLENDGSHASIYGDILLRSSSAYQQVSRKARKPYYAAVSQPAGNNDKAAAIRDHFLQVRFLSGYHMTWDEFQSIVPSIYAAHALIGLLSNLLDVVRGSWSKQAPLSSFQVKYGSLRLSASSADQVIPWGLVTDLAQNLLDMVKRGLLGFFRAIFTLGNLNRVAVVLAVPAAGGMFIREGFPFVEEGDGSMRNIIG